MRPPFACVSGLVDSCVYKDVDSTAAFHTLGAIINLCLFLVNSPRYLRPKYHWNQPKCSKDGEQTMHIKASLLTLFLPETWLKMLPSEWAVKCNAQRRTFILKATLCSSVLSVGCRWEYETCPSNGTQQAIATRDFKAVLKQGVECLPPPAQHILSLAQRETCCHCCPHPDSKMRLLFLRFLFNSSNFSTLRNREWSRDLHLFEKRCD